MTVKIMTTATKEIINIPTVAQQTAVPVLVFVAILVLGSSCAVFTTRQSRLSIATLVMVMGRVTITITLHTIKQMVHCNAWSMVREAFISGPSPMSSCV